MKDQFANYVVQKVLETCDDQQLELILNRIKVHLNALKKYTYGKHIVARVEKLVAAGGTVSFLFCLCFQFCSLPVFVPEMQTSYALRLSDCIASHVNGAFSMSALLHFQTL